VFPIFILIILLIWQLPNGNDFDFGREGSTNTRIVNYKNAIEQVMVKNPILGIGVKPKTDELSIPLGSHSTVISLFIKGGGVAFIFTMLVFFFVPMINGIRVLKKIASLQEKDKNFYKRLFVHIYAAQLSITIWLIFEDIDAPMFSAYVVFLQFGIFIHFNKFLKNRKSLNNGI
jgi:hypothetical protein